MKDLFEGCSVIMMKNDTVLMQLRDNKKGIFYPGYWCIPGGRIEKDEDPVAAVCREIEEETGYKLSDPFHFYTDTYINANGMKVRRYIYLAVYDTKQTISCFEGQKIEFKSIDEVQNLKIFPRQRLLILKALKIYRKLFAI